MVCTCVDTDDYVVRSEAEAKAKADAIHGPASVQMPAAVTRLASRERTGRE